VRERDVGETWIRQYPLGGRAVAVWMCLGDDRMLCILEDGTHFVTRDAKGFTMDSKDSQCNAVRVA
jgi:hypothetical protein